MALITNDVTDQDIENLFDKNDSSKFASKEESLIPKELDSKSDKSAATISRPDEYQTDETRQRKLDDKKKQEELRQQNHEKLLQLNGTVSRDVFNEVAKARAKAQLEEFISKQRKLPRINSNARYKLYNDKPQCTFHVYRINQMMDNGYMLCSCKFCSQTKIFSNIGWKKYELENRQYM